MSPTAAERLLSAWSAGRRARCRGSCCARWRGRRRRRSRRRSRCRRWSWSRGWSRGWRWSWSRCGSRRWFRYGGGVVAGPFTASIRRPSTLAGSPEEHENKCDQNENDSNILQTVHEKLSPNRTCCSDTISRVVRIRNDSRFWRAVLAERLACLTDLRPTQPAEG